MNTGTYRSINQTNPHTGFIDVNQDFHLSPREHQVLDLVVQGATYKEIASNLFISVNTVKAHLSHIRDKLEVSNMRQMVAYATGTGLSPNDGPVGLLATS